MAKITWTDESRRWLEDIFEHIAADNPDAADATVQGILHYGHFRIAYLIKVDGDVDILGVFHGALDITKYQL